MAEGGEMSSFKAFGLALALAVLLAACTKPQDALQQPIPVVPVVRAQHGDAVRSITLPGDLVGYYESTLYAKVTGYLKSISVDKGDWVKAGQVLAVIEVPELEQRLERARSDLDIQRLTYQRLDKVWKSDPRLVAREDVDIAYSRFQQAKAQVAELEAMMSYTRIVAPFDGVITGRLVDPGALIKAAGGSQGSETPFALGANEGSTHPGGTATPVVSEAMIDTLRIYVYVPQDEVSLIHRGTPASLILKDLPGRAFRGTVTRFAHSLDLSTRTMLTEVDIKNARHELYPGMYANVTLEIERHPNALELPESAVETSANGSSFVFVVTDRRLVKTGVSIGINTGREVEITSGLNGQEQVVSSFDPALTEGDRVRPVPVQSANPKSARPLADIR
jgi:membrane fusion protein (multidrug efflux system)